jgi:organic radical activating enzyme
MLIKGITDEDFVNYKVPSMYIATATCTFKCDKEYGSPICQNSELANVKPISVADDDIINRYVQNQITKAIVFGGLEPFDQFVQLFRLISKFRAAGVQDDIVIYTGWNRDELVSAKWDSYLVGSDGIEEYWGPSGLNCIHLLQTFSNIIVKFGRYIPNQQPHYDPVLGVYLASDNQYAEKIS